MLSLISLALLPCLLANPIQRDASASETAEPPCATFYPSTANGAAVEVKGISYPQFGQNVYLGVPYAQPPVGTKRFDRPQAATYNSTFLATAQKPACLQDPTNPLVGTNGISEDCLYLNVYTPETGSDSDPTLPVMFWIYGGAFTNGTTELYNASGLVGAGIETNKPVIFVAPSYRGGALGFGHGAEIAKNGAANLGIRDILFAMEWVKENIWAFGGDASKVTVFGESSGAILTSLLLLNPDIDSLSFSGAQSGIPIGPTESFWTDEYDSLVQFANCSDATEGSFECLKSISSDQLVEAQVKVQNKYLNAFPFAPTIDGDLIPDHPWDLIEAGKFARHPFINGNNKDEGTFFSDPSIDETGLVTLLNTTERGALTLNITADLLDLYPNDPALGSPFGTGNETFGISPVFKQEAAILGDVYFQAGRRHFMTSAVAHGMTDAWSYSFTQIATGAPPFFGSYHSSDIDYVFGAYSEAQNSSQTDIDLSHTMMQYWLNFATYTDPSGPNDTLPCWPRYGQDQQLLQLNGTNFTTLPDTYRQEQLEFLLDHHAELHY